MVDYARWYGVHVNVGEFICAYYHGRIVVIEGFDHFGQGVLVGIYIVTVELYAELAGLGVVCADIPTAADTEVVAVGHDVYYAGRR